MECLCQHRIALFRFHQIKLEEGRSENLLFDLCLLLSIKIFTMDVKDQYPTVYWIWGGGISFVYEVHPRIVLKAPKSGQFDGEQFRREVKVYEILSRHPPCPSIVQCFFHTDNGIFLEYMRGEPY